jgi:phosphatidylglycerophosphatase A
MSARTDRPESSDAPPTAKPRGALLFATAFGLGYLPKAPGTWGSLAGVLAYWALVRDRSLYSGVLLHFHGTRYAAPLLLLVFQLTVLLAAVGTAAAHEVSRALQIKDPQFVVIDEVSGQMLTYLFALAPANWKYLLLGFILFRVFDIWKPFPARQAESLPGGWGIMADDWIAGIYAALGLWLARFAGL